MSHASARISTMNQCIVVCILESKADDAAVGVGGSGTWCFVDKGCRGW